MHEFGVPLLNRTLRFGLAVMVAFAVVLPSTATTISCGEQITLHSKVLGEDRTIFVSLPDSYGNGSDKYPVLYLTDAQWQFAQTRTTVQFLARNGLLPEMIVVAVTNPDRTHDLYATRADFKQGGRTLPFPNSGNADQFLEFIQKELIPWTENAYRTSELRILAGHSAGGNFALHAMRTKPDLFQAIMVASPWLAWDDDRELRELLPFIAAGRVGVRNLFLSYADEGVEMKANVDALIGALKARNLPSLRWDWRTYPGETHDSTVIKSYFDGLRTIFAGYSYPRDPKTGRLMGSLGDVKTYYSNLGEKLGVPLGLPESVVNELGYEYLQAGGLEEAIAAFRFSVDQHPQSANAWDSLGEGLERGGNTADALAAYSKAIALAETNHDPNVDSFRKHLSRLRTKPEVNPQ